MTDADRTINGNMLFDRPTLKHVRESFTAQRKTTGALSPNKIKKTPHAS